MINSVILFLIHIFIDIFYFLQILYKDFQRCLLRWFQFWRCFLPINNELDKQVRMKKIPSHLGIIIKENNISLKDLSNIIIWSLCEGVKHVSLYDDQGHIKANAKKLYHESTIHKDIYLRRQSRNFNLVFSDGKVPYSHNVFIKNGHPAKNVFVYLLSHESGKQCIVDAAKQFCQDVTQNSVSLKDFHAKQFNCYIKSVIDIPDPQLILIFGKVAGLFGFLPWHIRLSEILFYPTHHNLQFQQFREFLCQYDRCEQRFGT